MQVLIVDDNREIIELMQTLLDAGGYEVHTSTSGKECLDLILKEKFDVILLDITMPKFSGFDVVQSLKDTNNLDKNNVILFTAASIPDEEIEKWVKMGVKGYLRKPFEPRELFEAIIEVSTST